MLVYATELISSFKFAILEIIDTCGDRLAIYI